MNSIHYASIKIIDDKKNESVKPPNLSLQFEWDYDNACIK